MSTTLLESLCALEGIEPPPPEAEDDTEDEAVTGYAVTPEDWEALKAIANGQASTVPEETASWLETCGLVEVGERPPVLTDFAEEWMAKSDQPAEEEREES